MEEDLTVGVGVAPAQVRLDLGDIHPSGHGALRIDCAVRDGIVVRADPQPGLLHRGVEKLFEARDYRQCLMLADRHDWLSPLTSEAAMALAIEELLGLEVPPRAVWLRTLLCEISRVSAALMHLAGAATVPPRGRAPWDVPAMAARERMLDLLEDISGGRVHPMFLRVGGVAQDAPDGWGGRVAEAVTFARESLTGLGDDIRRAIGESTWATVTAAQSRTWGISGPPARAAGLDLDLRRDQPYLAYGDLADVVRVATASGGGIADRYDVLLAQVGYDLDLIDACLERLPPGPVNVPLPKVVRAPEGDAYARVETATGVAGVYLVSTGEVAPWRMRLRTPSYAHVQAMSAVLPGTPLSELAMAVGSFMFVAGDVAR